MDRQESGRVVVGLSASLAGFAALRYAVSEARERGVGLLVVRTYRCSSGGLGAQWSDAMRSEAGNEVHRIFEEALGGVPADVSVTSAIQEGVPGRVLTDLATSARDMLVIGGSSRRWRGGRVAAHCARHARCAVVIVPEPELARIGSAQRLSKATDDVEKFLHNAVS